MKKVFFIDPNSYGKLQVYDYSLIKGYKNVDLTFIGNELFNCGQVTKFLPFFTYEKIKFGFAKALSYARSLIKIANIIVKEQPDVIHIEWLKLIYIDNLLLRFMQSKGCKVVFTAHNILPHDSGNRYKKQFGQYYTAVDHIIVHTAKTKDELIEMFQLSPYKISVINHGVMNYGFDNKKIDEAMHQISQKYDLKGKKIFGVFGTQSYYKGSDIIAEVWAKTPELRDNDQIRLFIGGVNGGIDFSSIKDIPNVILEEGNIEENDFNAWMRLCTASVLPYRVISQSGVLFASIANRTPVIVSEAGGLNDPLNVAKIGWNMGFANFNSLQSTLLYLVSNMNELDKVNSDEEAFKKVITHYSWDTISEMTENLYLKL